jgi:hypothetical protein
MLRAIVLSVALLCAAPAQAAADVSLWPARVREAGGAAAWQQMVALRSTGTLAVGGMEGEFEALEDARDGRSISRYQLGPMEGGQGYDGDTSWSRTGAETVVADSAEAKANAVTSAWLSRRGYFADAGAQYCAPKRAAMKAPTTSSSPRRPTAARRSSCGSTRKAPCSPAPCNASARTTR